MTHHTNATFENIALASLQVNEQNARKFQEATSGHRRTKFDELVASVREKGIIEPLVVRPIDDDNYQIIAGERRYRAAELVAADAGAAADYYKVPCMIWQVDDAEAFDLAIIENLQREDLTPFEAATAFKTYLDQFGNTPEAVSELAARTGLPAHAIRRQVRLLNLPTEILNIWGDGTITAGHVEAFTRIDDREKCLQVMGECLRRKFSVRELREHINGISPDLEQGFFYKDDCLACASNTSLQSGLFSEVETDGKCASPACFEDKQAAFLLSNWDKSKAAEQFRTRGFRFSHRLGQESREMITAEVTAARCFGCDQFVSVLRLTGLIMGGYARTCVGSRECFEELYCQTASNQVEISEVEETKQPVENQVESTEQPPAETPSTSKKKVAAAKETTGPVFSAQRGTRFRDTFFGNRLPALIALTPPDQAQSLRLVVLALALSSAAAKTELVAGLGSNDTPEDLTRKIFEIPMPELLPLLQQLASAQVMSSGYNSTTPTVRQVVAERFGIELHKEWCFTEDYLKDLKKSEIVKIGEEDQVNIWKDEKVKAYHREHFSGKGLMSLKREDLIDLVFKSGADLTGRVPAEILGKKK